LGTHRPPKGVASTSVGRSTLRRAHAVLSVQIQEPVPSHEVLTVVEHEDHEDIGVFDRTRTCSQEPSAARQTCSTTPSEQSCPPKSNDGIESKYDQKSTLALRRRYGPSGQPSSRASQLHRSWPPAHSARTRAPYHVPIGSERGNEVRCRGAHNRSRRGRAERSSSGANTAAAVDRVRHHRRLGSAGADGVADCATPAQAPHWRLMPRPPSD